MPAIENEAEFVPYGTVKSMEHKYVLFLSLTRARCLNSVCYIRMNMILGEVTTLR